MKHAFIPANEDALGRPLAMRGTTGAALIALLVAMLTAIGILAPSQAARAAVPCPPGSIYTNVAGASPALNQHSPTGALISSVPLARGYTDIAFLADGVTLYGIFPRSPMSLFLIDPATGKEIKEIQITGLPAAYYANALSALPDGNLVTGSSPTGTPATAQPTIYKIDPSTGVATLYPASFPSGFSSAGDFLSLADGDLLAVGYRDQESALFRISPTNVVTEVGKVPVSYGAAQAGGKIYLAGSRGDIYEIASVPTCASTAPVA